MPATTYTEERADIICSRLMDGETLTSICKDLKLRPNNIYQWTHERPDFKKRYYEAREAGDEVLEDLAIDAAKAYKEAKDRIEFEGKDNSSTTMKHYDNVQRSRIEAETYLKVVARRKGMRMLIQQTKLAGDEDSAGMKNVYDKLKAMVNGKA